MARKSNVEDWKDPKLTVDALRRCCGYEHGGDGVDLGKLVDIYVNCRLPFTVRKRDQFRDAIAILSLHHWADKNQETICIVSDDGDWAESPDFPRFKRVRMGDIVRELHRMQRDRAAIDGDRVQDVLESSEDEFVEALRCVTVCADDVEIEIEKANIKVVLQNVRKEGTVMVVRASFSGAGLGEVNHRYEHEYEYEWQVSPVISGIMEASLDEEYSLICMRVIECDADVSADLRSRRGGVLSARSDDDSGSLREQHRDMDLSKELPGPWRAGIDE